MLKSNFQSIDEYISTFPDEIQEKLQKIHSIIKSTAPEAEEGISYQMPAFKLNKRILVYFAAFKNHIGFFPTASGVKAFEKELVGYKFSKGTIQLPFDQEIPESLIRKIVLFKVKENLAK